MFEGNNQCMLCKKEMSEKEKVFGKSLLGYSYTFCNQCFRERKDQVRKILDDDKS